MCTFFYLQIWQFSDQNRAGFLTRQEFYNALKLVTVAQTGRDLTPELVKAALNGPAASQIPPPRINPKTPSPTSFAQTPPAQTPPSSQQGNYGQQFPASGFSAAGSGVTQARPSLGGLMGTSSLSSGAPGTGVTQARPNLGGLMGTSSLPSGAPGTGVTQARPSLGGLMGTSSLPSGAPGTHFSTGTGLPTGPGFQSTAGPGLPRPAAPSSMLSTGSSLPNTMSTPGFPLRMFATYLWYHCKCVLPFCDRCVLTNFIHIMFIILFSARRLIIQHIIIGVF